MRLHPRQYLECYPPIASKIDERDIQNRTRRDVMPVRSSNKHLKTAKSPSNSSGNGGDASAFSMRCLDFILGGKGSSSAPTPVALPPAVPLAIEDGGVGRAGPIVCYTAAAPVVVAAQQHTPPQTMDSILNQAKSTIAANAAAKPSKRKAKAKAKGKATGKRNPLVPPTSDENDEDVDEKEDDDGSTSDKDVEEGGESLDDDEEDEEEDDEAENVESGANDELHEHVVKKPSAVLKMLAAPIVEGRRYAIRQKTPAALVGRGGPKVKDVKGSGVKGKGAKGKGDKQGVVGVIKKAMVDKVVIKKRVAFIVPPGGPKPKPLFIPVHYGGGKIYFSASKASWRVYRRYGDKIEVLLPRI
jgi:hypothetical protein